MIKNRKDLVLAIKSLQQLIPGDDYSLYLEQAQRKYLEFIPPHRFMPSMDEKSPRSLNDIELNVLSKAKHNYLNNVFFPTIAEKQPHILLEKPRETQAQAIERWTEAIKNAQTPDELMNLIKNINRLKRKTKKAGGQQSWLKRLLGL